MALSDAANELSSFSSISIDGSTSNVSIDSSNPNAFRIFLSDDSLVLISLRSRSSSPDSIARRFTSAVIFFSLFLLSSSCSSNPAN